MTSDELIDRILRVDHAGEVGADKIYEGQLAVLKNTSVGPLIQVIIGMGEGRGGGKGDEECHPHSVLIVPAMTTR